MSTRLYDLFFGWVRRMRRTMVQDLSTPASRRKTWWHFYLFDAGFLRVWWTNFDQVAHGVYRSNQPSPARFAGLKARGIATILNLRGETRESYYLFEAEAAAAHGITLRSVPLGARRADSVAAFAALFEAFRTCEKPMLLHCKSGADRAGLASTLYLMAHEDVPLEQARKQLSFRYLHLKGTRTGILDHILDAYDADNAANPIGVEDWFATRYDPVALTASYARQRAQG